MKKRVELSGINVYKSIIESADNDNTDNEDISSLPDIEIGFRLRGETLSGYGPTYAAAVTDETGIVHPEMGGWPEMDVAFNITETDIPRVTAWFETNYGGVSDPESTTLIKNRKTALFNALNSYISTAKSHNLFTSPFRLGWCFKLTDGSLTALNDMGIFHTFLTAPVLPIISNTLSGTYLYTLVQIRNVPARVQMQTSDAAKLASYRDRIAAIEIFATEQTETYDDDGNVAGVRSVTVDDTPVRCWQYDYYSADEVELKTTESTTFRRIASISLDEIEEFAEFSNVPIAAGNLSNFTGLPAYSSLKDGSSGSTDDETSVTGWTRFITEYLHLDYPENEKSIRNVTLRGVFDRKNVRIRLYGSQHRDRRILLAATQGAYLRGVCRSRFRWMQVEIDCEMREGDFLEALTFDFSV